MLDESNKRGILIGIGIAVIVILAVVLTVLKIKCLKKALCCDCCEDYDDDYYLDTDDLDENGCAYTDEKDLV